MNWIRFYQGQLNWTADQWGWVTPILLSSIPDICLFFTQPQLEAKKFYDKNCRPTILCVKFHTVCIKAFFCVPIGKFYTWLILLQNQQLWLLWQISSMPSSFTGSFLQILDLWNFRSWRLRASKLWKYNYTNVKSMSELSHC